jgi:hypothetical protein
LQGESQGESPGGGESQGETQSEGETQDEKIRNFQGKIQISH